MNMMIVMAVTCYHCYCFWAFDFGKNFLISNMINSCGISINQSDLMILESHVVYSLSKEKTTAHFYIMQSTQSIREDLQVPIIDVLERFVLLTTILLLSTCLLICCGR
ncbi:unnamed protein product [Camellia sinensis]